MIWFVLRLSLCLYLLHSRKHTHTLILTLSHTPILQHFTLRLGYVPPFGTDRSKVPGFYCSCSNLILEGVHGRWARLYSPLHYSTLTLLSTHAILTHQVYFLFLRPHTFLIFFNIDFTIHKFLQLISFFIVSFLFLFFTFLFSFQLFLGSMKRGYSTKQ